MKPRKTQTISSRINGYAFAKSSIVGIGVCMKSLAARFITKADNGAKSGSGAPGDMRLVTEDLVNMMSEGFPYSSPHFCFKQRTTL